MHVPWVDRLGVTANSHSMKWRMEKAQKYKREFNDIHNCYNYRGTVVMCVSTSEKGNVWLLVNSHSREVDPIGDLLGIVCHHLVVWLTGVVRQSELSNLYLRITQPSMWHSGIAQSEVRLLYNVLQTIGNTINLLFTTNQFVYSNDESSECAYVRIYICTCMYIS